MSTTATKSGGYAPESQRFVEWSDFNENRWRYAGETIDKPKPNVSNPDTQNATVIRYDIDCRHDSKNRRKYKLLSEYNTGLRTGRGRINDNYNTNSLNRHLIQALASQLDLNPRFQREVERRFLSLDHQRFGTDINAVALAVCAAVIHGSGHNERDAHPSAKDLDPEFEKVGEGYREKILISLYNKIVQAGDKYRK